MPLQFELNPTEGRVNVLRLLQRIWSTKGELRGWAKPFSPLIEWVLPWTLIYNRPGVVTVAIDLSTYFAAHKASEFLKENRVLDVGEISRDIAAYLAHPESNRSILDFVRDDDQRALILQLVEKYRAGEVNLVFEVAPMWLVDP